jgi:hypothetical protein
MEWTGVRDRARTLSAQATFRRIGQTNPPRTYQIAVCIDDIPVLDSAATVVLEDSLIGSVFHTVSTLPISRDLVAGQVIKIQVRNVTDSLSIEINSSRISIT